MKSTTYVFRQWELTQRERQVLIGMSYGLTNASIGGRLRITENCIKTHIKRLMAKLQADSRAHAVRLGFKHGYLSTDDPHI